MNRREPLGQSFRFRKAGTPVDSEAALAELYQANVNSGALSARPVVRFDLWLVSHHRQSRITHPESHLSQAGGENNKHGYRRRSYRVVA